MPKALSKDAKEIINKVYIFFCIEATKFNTSDGYFHKVQSRVAEATGVSRKYVYKIAKEMDLATWKTNSVKEIGEAMNQKEESEDDLVEEQQEIDEAGSSLNTNTLNSVQLAVGQECKTVRKRNISPLPRDRHRVSKTAKSDEKKKVEYAIPKTINIMPKIVSVHQVRNEEPTTSYSILNTGNSVPALVPIQANTRKTIQYLPAGSNLIKIKTVPNLTPIQPKYELQNVQNIQLGSKLITLVPVPKNPNAVHNNMLPVNKNQISMSTSTKKLYSQVPLGNNKDSKRSGLVKKPAQQKKNVIKKIRNVKPKVVPKPKEEEYIEVEAKTVPIEFDPLFLNSEFKIKTESIEILD